MSLTVKAVTVLEKGKAKLCLDNGEEFLLYRGELRKLSIWEGSILSEEQYDMIMKEILGKRAKKRAMHLLESQDRTEHQLYDKLKQNGYPEACIEEAITYVKNYHYIDDLRYARTYIRFHQEKKSRQRLKMDLASKGVGRDLIEQALEEEFVSDEKQQIWLLLQKHHYEAGCADEKEKRRMYQFLMRRGFKSHDIISMMQVTAEKPDV